MSIRERELRHRSSVGVAAIDVLNSLAKAIVGIEVHRHDRFYGKNDENSSQYDDPMDREVFQIIHCPRATEQAD
jgi:hypothetical protein